MTSRRAGFIGSAYGGWPAGLGFNHSLSRWMRTTVMPPRRRAMTGDGKAPGDGVIC
jgi:hypothetical protein